MSAQQPVLYEQVPVAMTMCIIRGRMLALFNRNDVTAGRTMDYSR